MLVEQRSQEWFDLRKGKITSSEIYKIMGDAKGKELLTETAKSYLLEKVSESLGGFSAPAVGAALEWGTDLEDTAREIYQAKTGNITTKCSFIAVNDFYGGSPDAIVEPEGVIEIKCPYGSANHFRYGLINSAADLKKAATGYYYQCMSHMIVTGAKWCDFISFDPRVDADYMMFVYRLERDEEEIANMRNKIDIAIEYMAEIRQKLPKYMIAPTANETAEG
jgi:putative phage-type endonuclease